MFSFRTTTIEEQLDRSLTEGKVGVFCTQNCWNAFTGKYLYEVFRERGNLEKVFMPDGEHIEFTPEELACLDAVVVEIQDIGSRYFGYTIDVLRLISTLNNLPEGKVSLYIVDHPNPAGRDVEGTLPVGESDVWTPNVAHRHGLTLGELAHLYHSETGSSYPLHIISAYASASNRTLLPWVIPPAADMSGMFTPFVYSGSSLWTDTTITPAIGTTRPYEMFGAPFIKPVNANAPVPEGVYLRPCSFIPEYGKYEGEKCYGFQIILMPETHYHSILHTIRLMRYFAERYSQFEIGESLYTRLADPVMSEYLKGRITFDIVEEHVKSDEQKWIRKAKRYLLYDDSPCRIK